MGPGHGVTDERKILISSGSHFKMGKTQILEMGAGAGPGVTDERSAGESQS